MFKKTAKWGDATPEAIYGKSATNTLGLSKNNFVDKFVVEESLFNLNNLYILK